MNLQFDFTIGNLPIQITIPSTFPEYVTLGTRFRCFSYPPYPQFITNTEFYNDINALLDYIKSNHLEINNINSYSKALEYIINKHVNRYKRMIFKDLLVYMDEYAELLNALGLAESSLRGKYDGEDVPQSVKRAAMDLYLRDRYELELKKHLDIYSQKGVLDLGDFEDERIYKHLMGQY